MGKHVSRIGPQLISRGKGGKSYWAQVTCQKCDAWLPMMPERSIQGTGADQELFHYFWTCSQCGYKREILESGPPTTWEPDPEIELQEPGTFPKSPRKDPYTWDYAGLLSQLQKDLVIECWKMVEPLYGHLTIHKVNYYWNLQKALESESISEITFAAKDYVDLMDYEEVHGQEDSSYHGEIGDYSSIKILF